MLGAMGGDPNQGVVRHDGVERYTKTHFQALAVLLLALLIIAVATAVSYWHVAGLWRNDSLVSMQRNITALKNQLYTAETQINDSQARIIYLTGQLQNLQNASANCQANASTNASLTHLRAQVGSYSNTISALQLQLSNLTTNVNMSNVQVAIQRTSLPLQAGNTTKFTIVPDFPGKLVVNVWANAQFTIIITSPNFSGMYYSTLLPAGKYTFTAPVVGTSSNPYTYYVELGNSSGGPNTYAINATINN